MRSSFRHNYDVCVWYSPCDHGTERNKIPREIWRDLFSRHGVNMRAKGPENHTLNDQAMIYDFLMRITNEWIGRGAGIGDIGRSVNHLSSSIFVSNIALDTLYITSSMGVTPSFILHQHFPPLFRIAYSRALWAATLFFFSGLFLSHGESTVSAIPFIGPWSMDALICNLSINFRVKVLFRLTTKTRSFEPASTQAMPRFFECVNGSKRVLVKGPEWGGN